MEHETRVLYKLRHRGPSQAWYRLARFRAPFKRLKDCQISSTCREVTMLRWALAFFIVALVAALLGFTGMAVAAAGIAKILFFIFLILFLVTLVGHLFRRT
jgi:uncharacterized membrane protein YtjA (UPF0391 family)